MAYIAKQPNVSKNGRLANAAGATLPSQRMVAPLSNFEISEVPLGPPSQVSITVHRVSYPELPPFPFSPPPPGPKPATLKDLLTLAPEEMAKVDIGRMNLLCAAGLPGSDGIDIDEMETTLDEWAKEVERQTKRVYYKFLEHPENWDNSEAFFRVSVLVFTLKDVYHVHYDPKYAIPGVAPEEKAFFADSKDAFLHGLLGPQRIGSCGTLPVLMVAVGQRLGYPMKVAASYNHGFVRWESPDGKERFNVETTGEGMSKRTDDFYATWPKPVSAKIIQDMHFLQSMTPLEELSAFLRSRVSALKVAHRLDEAWDTALEAQRLAPGWGQNRVFLAELFRLRNPGLVEGMQLSLDTPLRKNTNNTYPDLVGFNPSNQPPDPADFQNEDYIGLSPEIARLLPPEVLRTMPRRPSLSPPDPTPIDPFPGIPSPNSRPSIRLPPGIPKIPGLPSLPQPYSVPGVINTSPYGPNAGPDPFNPNAPAP